MSFITKKLEEFINKFGLNGLHAKPVEYMDYDDVTDKVEAFLSTALDEMIMEVEKGLPEEEVCDCHNTTKDDYCCNRVIGANQYRQEVINLLSSLREGNK